MPVVTADKIGRHYGVHRVLEGASVTIHRGERVGVVGANGAGKSTLGKILAGVEAPDSGTVTRRRGAKVFYLDQAPVLPEGRTASQVALSGLEEWCVARSRFDSASERLAAADAACLASATAEQATAAEDLERLGGWDLVHRAESILGHLGIDDVGRDVGRMSGGERRRVALARLLVARPDLAILDEPTNHLDVDTVAWLERFLIEDFDGAVLLITHDRYLLDRVAQRTLEVGRGVATSYDGGYETYLEARAERLAHEERSERNRQNFLRTELEWLRRQPKARTGKSRARIQRIEAAVGREQIRAGGVAQIEAAEVRSGKTILELEGASIGLGDRVLASSIDLHVTQGERIGVVGANGCGKTTLLRTVVGELEVLSGVLNRGHNTSLAYLDQARGSLDDDSTVFENVIGDLAAIRVGDRELTPRSYLERFLFDDAAQRSTVGTLSGGERARVALAAMLAKPANLMILDEPTNDLDIETLNSLESFLLEFGGTTIVVTHDRYFLDRVATSILAFENEGTLRRFHGTYSSYLVQRTDSDEATTSSPATNPRPEARKGAPSAKLTYREQKELVALPDQIESLEKKITAVEERLADPLTYAERGNDVAGLSSELSDAREEVERLVLRWEELETKKEKAARERR